MKRRILLLVLVLSMSVILMSSSMLNAWADSSDYPNGDITMIVPVKAGGDTDVYARIMERYIAKELGTNIAVENIDGATGTIGSRQVYEGAADGYTLLFFHDASILAELTGVTDIKLSQFRIISIPLVTWGGTLVTRADKFSSPEDFFERAKNGEKIICSAATGSLSQLAPLQLEQQIGCSFKFVDSTSGSERIADLLAGRIDLFYTQYGTIEQYIQSGDFMSLGLLADERDPNFADVPTLKEQGIDVSIPKFYYIACAPDTPDEIVEKIADAIEKSCENQDMQDELAAFYVKAVYMSPDESQEFVLAREASYAPFAELLNQ